MVVLPQCFVQLPRYPGYYWNVDNKKLYSCKSGVLKQLYKKPPFYGFVNGVKVNSDGGYQVSVQGVKKMISMRYLNTVKVPSVQIFPVEE